MLMKFCMGWYTLVLNDSKVDRKAAFSCKLHT